MLLEKWNTGVDLLVTIVVRQSGDGKDTDQATALANCCRGLHYSIVYLSMYMLQTVVINKHNTPGATAAVPSVFGARAPPVTASGTVGVTKPCPLRWSAPRKQEIKILFLLLYSSFLQATRHYYKWYSISYAPVFWTRSFPLRSWMRPWATGSFSPTRGALLWVYENIKMWIRQNTSGSH